MKKALRITFLSIGILIEIAYLIFAAISVYIFGVTDDDSVPMPFFITMTIHAIFALVISVAGIVRAIKNCKWVLITGFFMQLWLVWMAFSVAIYIAVQVLFPFVFIVFGILVYIMFYAISKTFKNAPKPKFISGFNNIFIFSCEDTLGDAMCEYCMQFNKTEKSLTEKDQDLIFDYASNWILYLIIWIIKNNYYSDSFKSELGDNLIAQVKADIISTEELINKTSGILTDAEVCAEIKPFLSEYSEPLRNDSYWNDYLEVIKAEQSRYSYVIPANGNYLEYCIDFNINIYYDIADRINQAYYYFKQRNLQQPQSANKNNLY